MFDRIGSAAYGRPICAREEEYAPKFGLMAFFSEYVCSIDVEFPLEVDDEFWVPADPSQPAFVQPEGKLSSITSFVYMLKLNQIMAQALRTIVRCVKRVSLCS